MFFMYIITINCELTNFDDFILFIYSQPGACQMVTFKFYSADEYS